MIYIFHFFAVLMLFILFGRNKQTENIFTVTSFVYVLFVFGQRWMTGTDFPNYLRFYLQDFTRSEWGYFGIQSLLRNGGLYFGIIIFIILFITQINFYRFFLKFDQGALMIFLFLISEIFFAQMSQLRQYVAISFFINSYYSAYKSEYFKSIINIIFAFSFHTSALFFIPFLFLKLPINRKIALAFFITALILPLIDIHLVLELPIFGRYSGYLGGQFDVPLGFGHSIKYYTILLIFIFYVYYLKPLVQSERNKMIINSLMIYILIYGLSFHFAPLFRVATFFQVFEVVFLVYYADKLRILPEIDAQKVIAFLFIGIFTFSGLIDSYNVSDYQFRSLRFHENRNVDELVNEIESNTY